MIDTDVQGDVAEILNDFYESQNYMFLVDNQNGVHPNTVFGIVGEVSRTPIGTMRKEIRSSTGEYIYAQPFEFLINIGVQGREDSNAANLSMDIRFLLNTPVLKRLFRQKGYSVRVDDGDTKRIPMPKNTDMFLRHTFSVWITCDLYQKLTLEPLNQVDVTGDIDDLAGQDITEYNEIIGEP